MDKKRIAILIVTLIGILTTLKLAWVYYDVNFNPYALASFCSINDIVDCDGVAKTVHSQFLGVPLALWGLLLYSVMFFMLFVDRLNFGVFKVFKNPLDYIAVLGSTSFVICMGLLFLSIFELKKLCLLCLVTYILNLAAALLAVEGLRGGLTALGDGFVKAFRNSIFDFVAAVKQYKVAFITSVICAIALLTYTNVSMVLAPQVKHARMFKEFVQVEVNKYKISGNILGAQEPKVVVQVYSDYKCPICYAHNIMMHKLARELKEVQIVHHNLPLDMECNKYLQNPFHQGACLGARYAIAAEQQNNMWGMNEILFQYKPETELQILELARVAGFDDEKLKKDANSRQTIKRLQAEIDEGLSRGFNGTPVTVVGDEHIIGIRPYDEFKTLVLKNVRKK